MWGGGRLRPGWLTGRQLSARQQVAQLSQPIPGVWWRGRGGGGGGGGGLRLGWLTGRQPSAVSR